MNRQVELMYTRLADFLMENLDLHEGVLILEAGCGKGQLTIPLAKRIRGKMVDFRIIAFDISAGPYKGALDVLKESIRKEGFGKIIEIVQGDVRDMSSIGDQSVDVVISNELFCDLGRKGLEKALEEFHRILKPNGRMAHGELNPVPENAAQKLLIEADSCSLETLTSGYEWFSPYSDEVAALMHKVGFGNMMVKYSETDVHLSFDDAIRQLKEWNISPAFVKSHIEDLRRYGLEFPIEHVVFCQKRGEACDRSFV
ncbi:MAG: class I SAM-dependent methyltransferase [Candidatus Bathyarchaeia archaeon]